MKPKKVVILHQDVLSNASADELDVLTQVETVKVGLREMNHEPISVPFHLRHHEIEHRLRAIDPDYVFNLVESVEGRGRWIDLAPSQLDELKIPYTGCSSAAIRHTSNKLFAKEKLRAHGLATPEWIANRRQALVRGEPYIVKAIWEHASIGIDEDSVSVPKNVQDLREKIARKSRKMDFRCFAERYVHGREFNVALIDGEVLPISEIRFEKHSDQKYQVLGYRSKWDASSVEYQSSVPSFDFLDHDHALLSELRSIAKQCWNIFELNGYARVDFRVDEAGKPWVLEVNANPCLSPGSGFHNAAIQAGISFPQVLEKLTASLVST